MLVKDGCSYDNEMQLSLDLLSSGTIEDAHFPAYMKAISLKGLFASIANCSIILFESTLTHKICRIMVETPTWDNWVDVEREYNKLKELYTKKYGEGESKESIIERDDYSHYYVNDFDRLYNNRGEWHTSYCPLNNMYFQYQVEITSKKYQSHTYKGCITINYLSQNYLDHLIKLEQMTLEEI